MPEPSLSSKYFCIIASQNWRTQLRGQTEEEDVPCIFSEGELVTVSLVTCKCKKKRVPVQLWDIFLFRIA